MAERLDLIKNVFNKAEYIKTVNTSFSELGNISITNQQIEQPNIEEFFGLYNSLFYDIPALGETNSHQYLIRTSGEYINFNESQAEIEALQAEIAQLRSDLLKVQMENVRASVDGSQNGQSNEALEVLERELEAANEGLIETQSTLANNIQTTTTQTAISSGGQSSGNNSGASSGGNTGGGGGGY